MSKTTKIVLGVVAVIVVVAVGVGFVLARLVGRSFTLDAEQAATIGQEIVTHELPPQFEPFFGLDAFGLRAMMAATSFQSTGSVSEDGSILFIISLPEGTSEDDLRSQAGGEFSSQSGQNIRFEYVGNRIEKVNGEEVQVEMYVGTDRGVTFRQELAVFNADNGAPAMMIMMAPESVFEAAQFENLLASTN